MTSDSAENGLLTAIEDDELTQEGNAQLEKALQILDEFQGELQQQRENAKNPDAKVDSHLPDILKGDGLDASQVFELLKDTISETEFETVERFLASDEKTATGKTDLLAASAVLQNIIAYLDVRDRKTLTEKLKSDVALFFSKLYRFESNTCAVHLQDDRDSAVHVTRLALGARYDQYDTDGYLECVEHAPVIYISQAGPASVAAQVCHVLGLPTSCVSVVPTTTVERDASNKELHPDSLTLHKHEIDVPALDRIMRNDTIAGKRPLIVIANAGSPALGHNDPIHLLRVICNKHKVWLHVRGPNLALKALSVNSIPLLAASKADSVTLTPGDWYGIPTLPTCTLVRPGLDSGFQGAMSHHHLQITPGLELAYVPLWLSMVCLGHAGMTGKAIHAQELTAKFASELSKNDNVDVSVRVSRIEKQEAVTFNSFSSFIKAAKDEVDSLTMEKPGIVCFRLAPTEAIRQTLTEKLPSFQQTRALAQQSAPETEPSPVAVPTPDAEKESEADCCSDDDVSENASVAESQSVGLDEFLTDLYDSLNVRLYETIQDNLTRIAIDAVSLGERIFLRFQPVQSAAKRGTTIDNLDHSLQFIHREINVSTKLISQIQAIRTSVSKSDNLDYYCDPDSFSLGLLQVVPTFLQHMDVSMLTHQEADDLDLVNKATLQKFNMTQELSFARITADVAGNKHIALHLESISTENDEVEVAALIDQISKIGHDAEKDLLELKEFTKNLIEAKTKAEAELETVKVKVQEEESVIEKIPIMGSLVGMFFGSTDPEQTNKKLVGRSFNVRTGHMYSTKKTYDSMEQQSRPETPAKVEAEGDTVETGAESVDNDVHDFPEQEVPAEDLPSQ